ncbi:hypothetical protein LshimejAT787_0806200 [Lyophyllum shimeji]|uniref:Uncharacterized protein n=1 Tax=Lyophyllum shimeji TaxID=47721 RepID=A0A9P3UMR5_LYOSH|nr:hypothetical protein LshimejAT787_0806200 [Lyophyllum shimeji]
MVRFSNGTRSLRCLPLRPPALNYKLPSALSGFMASNVTSQGSEIGVVSSHAWNLYASRESSRLVPISRLLNCVVRDPTFPSASKQAPHIAEHSQDETVPAQRSQH